jgi:carboxypeptidase Taq
MAYEHFWEQYVQHMRDMRGVEEAIALMHWDMRTIGVRKGSAWRAESIGILTAHHMTLATSEQLGAWIEELRTAPIAVWQRASVARMAHRYERLRAIPLEEYKAFVIACAEAETMWERGKSEGDFTLFRPYLERIVAFARAFAKQWGAGAAHPYDAWLADDDPNMTVARLDPLFGALRAELVPFMQDIAHAQQRGQSLPRVPISMQRTAQEQLLALIGFDASAGRIDESAHPFMTAINPCDVRVTTRYSEDDCTSALFSTLHEGGHALYEQRIAPMFHGTNVCTGASLAMHESQARLWENVIGRSPAFWNAHFRTLQSWMPPLRDTSIGHFVSAINSVQPSPIRTEADELTYNVHIMIRYELEKQLMSGALDVAQLPQAWNEAYARDLGIVPRDEAHGVFQDVHWAGGAFGYFPSYTLGNLIAAHIWETMCEAGLGTQLHDIPKIVHWLTEHVYTHGATMHTDAFLDRVCNDTLDTAPFMRYVKDKYEGLMHVGQTPRIQ